MTLTYEPPRRTPLTFREAASALETALGQLIGGPPTVKTLALALAHTALETGRWQSLYNYNWGNVKALGTYSGPYTCLGTLAKPVNEVIGGQVFWFIPESEVTGKNGELIGERWAVPPGHPQSRFRAYPNAAVGAERYVRLLGDTSRYVDAWEQLLAGNAAQFVTELKKASYFTGNEVKYRDAVVSLQQEFLGLLGSPDSGETSAVPQEYIRPGSGNGGLIALFF